jgi:hypothetical protein
MAKRKRNDSADEDISDCPFTLTDHTIHSSKKRPKLLNGAVDSQGAACLFDDTWKCGELGEGRKVIPPEKWRSLHPYNSFIREFFALPL